MKLVAVVLGALSAIALYAAAPEWGAADHNRELRNACASARAIRPSVECPLPVREVWATDWLLIATVLAVGAAVVVALSGRQHR